MFAVNNGRLYVLKGFVFYSFFRAYIDLFIVRISKSGREAKG